MKTLWNTIRQHYVKTKKWTSSPKLDLITFHHFTVRSIVINCALLILCASHQSTRTKAPHTWFLTHRWVVKVRGAHRCVCVFVFLMWDDNEADKIQLSKPLVTQVETKSFNSLFDSCFSPRPNSCCVLPELALSDHPVSAHSQKKKRQMRLRVVSGASMQKVSEWRKARTVIVG